MRKSAGRKALEQLISEGISIETIRAEVVSLFCKHLKPEERKSEKRGDGVIPCPFVVGEIIEFQDDASGFWGVKSIIKKIMEGRAILNVQPFPEKDKQFRAVNIPCRADWSDVRKVNIPLPRRAGKKPPIGKKNSKKEVIKPG